MNLYISSRYITHSLCAPSLLFVLQMMILIKCSMLQAKINPFYKPTRDLQVMAGKLPLHTYFLAFGLKWILLVTRFCLLLALMMKKLKSLSPQFLNLDVRMIDVCFNMYEQEFCFNCILAIDAIVCTIDRSTGCLFRLLIWMHKSSFQI